LAAIVARYRFKIPVYRVAVGNSMRIRGAMPRFGLQAGAVWSNART
jgi:hypothetical protein